MLLLPEPEEQNSDQGLNALDDVVYPVLALLVLPDNQEPTLAANLPTNLGWRQKLNRAFRQQRLAGAATIIDTTVQPRAIADPQGWVANYYVSALSFRFTSREPRGFVHSVRNRLHAANKKRLEGVLQMTATTASLGWASRAALIVETTYGTTPAPGTNAALDFAFVFSACTVGKHGTIVERDGLRGSRSRYATDARTGPYVVAGTIVTEPTPTDLETWLPLIFGGTLTGGAVALADTLPSFSLGVDRVAKRFRYTGCKVRRAVFAGSQGGLLRMSLDIVGQAESADAAAWPAIAPDASQGPFIFSDAASGLTLNATQREFCDFELVIDNGLVTNRFMNSLTVVNLPERDRHITLNTTHAFAAANLDLYDQALAGAAGSLVLTSTQGSPSVLSFEFADLQVPAQPTGVDNRSELLLKLAMVARKTGSTLEASANIVV